MKDADLEMNSDSNSEEQELETRRGFLVATKNWSKAVVAGALVGAFAAFSSKKASAGAWANGGRGWVNRGGGGWVNRRGGGGWLNRR